MYVASVIQFWEYFHRIGFSIVCKFLTFFTTATEKLAVIFTSFLAHFLIKQLFRVDLSAFPYFWQMA